ncbi:hypothetical protein QMK19_25885 [Streptomyces sp. H10-C2]|uniref:hypothetical protein n=1 Tax=unclassified Streptomyces TaxID=2593676 RepID=UPI0024BAC448|nr:MULTISPECIES: hypothetical protein [unclassified Streptomyces]MDJ0345628.1 hypothetical protein [Streptomyces sp. PH10-H1]MDJ0372993.1 hypothetical protein [Streptomyces sp. H10-C2]
MLGTYTCDQVPGTLRLSRKNRALYLWRRTRDRLTRTGPTTYTADGYTLTLAATAGESGPRADDFVVDLERAPGLHYQSRQEPAGTPS